MKVLRVLREAREDRNNRCLRIIDTVFGYVVWILGFCSLVFRWAERLAPLLPVYVDIDVLDFFILLIVILSLDVEKIITYTIEKALTKK